MHIAAMGPRFHKTRILSFVIHTIQYNYVYHCSSKLMHCVDKPDSKSQSFYVKGGSTLSVFTKQGGTKLIASLSPHSATNNPEHICEELHIHCILQL